MTEVPADQPLRHVTTQIKAGLIIAVLGCVFGIMGIFAYGVIFSPICLVCAVLGFAFSLFGLSWWGVGASLLACVLGLGGLLKSPLVLIAVAIGFLGSLFHWGSSHPTASTSIANGATVRVTAVSNSPALNAVAVPGWIPARVPVDPPSTANLDTSDVVAQQGQMAAARDTENAAAARVAEGHNLLQLTQRVSDETDAMERAAPDLINRLVEFDQQYAELGREARHRRQQQRVFAGGGLGVASMRAGTDAQGLLVQLDGIHGSVNGMRGDARTSVAQVRSDLSSMELACRQDPLHGEPSDPCGEAAGYRSRLDNAVGPLATAFDSSEKAYNNAVELANERPHLLGRMLQKQ